MNNFGAQLREEPAADLRSPTANLDDTQSRKEWPSSSNLGNTTLSGH